MSNVSLEIGGRSFTVACGAGEEEHVAQLGREIDARVTQSGTRGLSEPRMLLFAALLLADEVHELKAMTATEPQPAEDDTGTIVAETLNMLATRIENLAQLVESGLEYETADH
ncbi:cell division protein ZapA [Novosphingobium sp. YJ-S2-02]|uniref:Cell division protein ZapA n=1 Tax=Novosphingobium aureum TaxID=2792964 RepID=A0A931HD89_9SPHN|nr:cell division protein ZapA [Novosphingobium aureum]MBH0113657.1 cell division protein ZapA [Novosphingobium aureum]